MRALTHFELWVRDLIGELVVRQRYVNRRDRAIEALFTFPMAMDATFLGMEARVGERTLVGAIAARREARETYEEAVGRGDASILLERQAADLYTANLGNVNPGEAVELSIRFGLLLRPADGQLRLRLPATIAPRYGRSTLEAPDEPEHSLFIEHRFALEAGFDGLLARAEASCPSHAGAFARRDGRTTLTIAGASAFLDRDVVVLFDGVSVPALSAYSASFEGRSLMLAAVHVPAAEAIKRPLLSVAIVVDCSGSMAGDSIRLARQGLSAALTELGEGDRFTILRFGSSVDRAFGALVPAVETHVRRAQGVLAGMEADLGGTEMGAALGAALDALDGESGERVVYLLSDGETHAAQIDEVARRARQRGIRLFTVGIGAAPVEAVMRPLAERTSGSAEYVAPGESMAPRIARHFARMRRASLGRVAIPDSAGWAWTVVPSCAGAGETFWVAGERSGAEEAPVAIRFGDTGVVETECVATADVDAERVRRLAAALRLAEPASAGFDPAAFAVRHQLLTVDTACVLVVRRADGERAVELPATVKVPQMLAAGWGGTSVSARVDCCSMMAHDDRESDDEALDFAIDGDEGVPTLRVALRRAGTYGIPSPTWTAKHWTRALASLVADSALQELVAKLAAAGYDIEDSQVFLAWLRVIDDEGLLEPRRLRNRTARIGLRFHLDGATAIDPVLVAAIRAAVTDRGLHARLLERFLTTG